MVECRANAQVYIHFVQLLPKKQDCASRKTSLAERTKNKSMLYDRRKYLDLHAKARKHLHIPNQFTVLVNVNAAILKWGDLHNQLDCKVEEKRRRTCNRAEDGRMCETCFSCSKGKSER